MNFQILAAITLSISGPVFAETVNDMNAETATVQADQARLKSEVERLSKETAASEKQSQQAKTQLDKMKAELETLRNLRNEKAQAYITLTSQHDKIADEIKKTEQEKFQLETDLAKSKEQEKAAADKLAKIKAEQAAKKVKLDAYIAGLRDRFRKAQERLAAMEAEGNQATVAGQKLEATSKTAENEVIAVEDRLSRAPSSVAPSGGYTFKRNCKAYDKPAKDAGVLAVQKAGSQVAKTDEGKSWIAFALPDGRKAYVAKTCF